MSKESMIKRDIKKDIDKIKEILESNFEKNELIDVHMYIDSKYQSKIDNWGYSQYCWSDKLGFDYNMLGQEALKHNLINMKGKLDGYLQDYRFIINAPVATDIKVVNNNTNTNKLNVEMDFQSLINRVNKMESLTDIETKDAISKIKEIETIYKSKESKKKKWDKIKNILIWLADKSVDLAIEYLPIITSSLN